MRKKHLFLHTASLCLFLLCGCSITKTPTPEAAYISEIPTPTPSFNEFATGIFVDEITTDTISLHYSLSEPANYGISDYPITLGSVTDAVSFDDDALSLYEQLTAYDPNTLSEEEALTWYSLEHHLDLLLQEDYSPYLSELLGPTTGYQAQLPILLAEFRFDTKEDVEHYLALLQSVYDYFGEIAAFEREKSAAGYFMKDTTAAEIIAQCEQFVSDPDHNFLITTFEERLASLNLTASETADFLTRNQTALYSYVFPAYELLIDALTDCLGSNKNPYGLAHFEGGEDFYALLTAFSTGSDKSVSELKEQLLNAITHGCNKMAVLLAEHPALYDNALDMDYPETDPAAIISYLADATRDDFPAIDYSGASVKYIPEALQEYVSPAMYLIPPMDRYHTGVIYINRSPVYDLDSLFPTVAHEGYPGHLYQTVATLSGEIHPLRYLLAPTGYEEGWATYAETYCYKYAHLSDELTAFLQADQIATLCLYALSDIHIHYDGYTPEQLSTFLSVYGFPEKTSDVIYETLLAEPGAYLPYAVGYLEFVELQELAKTLWGENYSDYRFHEFLINAGPMPFELLETQLKNAL